jgi:hypothetical protein
MHAFLLIFWPFDNPSAGPFDELKSSRSGYAQGHFSALLCTRVGDLESLGFARDIEFVEMQAKGASTFGGVPLSASKWLPIVDEFRNFLMSEDANIVLEKIKDF